MRLNRIKIVGFKSFVDPMQLKLPSNLVGVVGPNGCGKSNTIDAVRWVMGESSAKHLRGESMDDVIFTGSTTRKPVGQASVELVFDNADGSLGGQYAAYNEIAVKRQVSRDGQSVYFLNGSRCRRRDITDIFLGTGLGPRSYAIIEQGMVSKLVEAKPHELRVYIEEAAGISKYKERRRETENRIRNTRDNLDRLNDLCEEVDKQLSHLKRQATIAERFREYKAEERKLGGELLVLRVTDFEQQRDKHQLGLTALATGLEQSVAQQRRAEAEIETARASHQSTTIRFNDIQAQVYELSAAISKEEQKLQHQRESRERQTRELNEVQGALTEAESHVEEDQDTLEQIAEELLEAEPSMSENHDDQQGSAELLARLESSQSEWQKRWANYQQEHGDQLRKAQVEKSRIEQYQRGQQQLQTRLERLLSDQKELTETDEDEIEDLLMEEETAEERVSELEDNLESTKEVIDLERAKLKTQTLELSQLRNEGQKLSGRLSSLEALQQAALADQSAGVSEWLKEHSLTDKPKLAQMLKVEPGWESAVEVVLANHLDAVQVDDVTSVGASINGLSQGALELMSPDACAFTEAKTGSLATKVSGAPHINGLLNQVLIASDLSEAFDWQASLDQDQMVVTSEGVLLGRHWVRVARAVSEREGMLARETEIALVRKEFDGFEERIFELESGVEVLDESLQKHQMSRDQLHAAVNDAQRQHSEIKAKIQSTRQKIEQNRLRIARLNDDREECESQLESESNALMEAIEVRDMALEALAELETQEDSLNHEREAIEQKLAHARDQARQDAETRQALAIRFESLKSRQQAIKENLQRMESQIVHMQRRRDELQVSLDQLEEPGHDEYAELEEFIEEKDVVERRLKIAKEELTGLDNTIREQDQLRVKAERDGNDVRTQLEAARLQAQEIHVRIQTLLEQLEDDEHDAVTIKLDMPEEANIHGWADRISSLQTKVQRLGSINLAAIEEYQEQLKRKEYLDQQHADITDALETLESAIAEIDKETKQRFKDTFDKVNVKVQEFFPRLFGGGSGKLELTDQDMLTAGVAVLARPPGKRVSNIHLLSGGEKALTAVAMVFAFFELNPAPFCMLDEVDAPLDDANVGRFCALVKEMSERVQFIFITHNKVTMELASHLMGVTMHEPGVSRLVSVDVQEAAQLAGV